MKSSMLVSTVVAAAVVSIVAAGSALPPARSPVVRMPASHFWSFDRDNDCTQSYASPTCNSYGQAGRLGFTTQFLSQLGQ